MRYDMDQLIAIMERLRNPDDGCPWDVEQSFASIAPHTIEEAYEVADAIEHDDMVGLKDELGDLLFQVVFHSRIAQERGTFDFADVVASVSEKMIRRHPHVFGDSLIDNAHQQALAWEEIKAAERASKNASGKPQDDSAMAGVISALPALLRAQKLQKRAARVGFDWPDTGPVFDKLQEEIAEVAAEMTETPDRDRLEDEIGDLLFVCVNLARKLDIDAETALRRGNRKFERRFRQMERTATTAGTAFSGLDLDRMEQLWTDVKSEE